MIYRLGQFLVDLRSASISHCKCTVRTLVRRANHVTMDGHWWFSCHVTIFENISFWEKPKLRVPPVGLDGVNFDSYRMIYLKLSGVGRNLGPVHVPTLITIRRSSYLRVLALPRRLMSVRILWQLKAARPPPDKRPPAPKTSKSSWWDLITFHRQDWIERVTWPLKPANPVPCYTDDHVTPPRRTWFI